MSGVGSPRDPKSCAGHMATSSSLPVPGRIQLAGRKGEQGKNQLPRNQNGSRCCHRPPLVPGPNCRAGEGLASFPSGLNSIGASSLGVRGSGRGLATPVGSHEQFSGEPGTCPFCVSFGRSLRSRWSFEESGIGLRLTLLPRWSFHRAGCLRSEDRRPRPRWSRFRTFFPCGKSVPHREV